MNYKGSGKDEFILEMRCNPDKYLSFIELNYKENPNNYYISRAYGLSFKGDYEEANLEFLKVAKSAIDIESNFYPIYIRTEITLAYIEKDSDRLKEIVEELTPLEEKHELPLRYAEAFIILLEENYEALSELLFENIPIQTKRIHIIELEYYLALAYSKTDRLDDAKAVLTFVIGKNHPIIFTKLSKELLKEID